MRARPAHGVYTETGRTERLNFLRLNPEAGLNSNRGWDGSALDRVGFDGARYECSIFI